MSKKSNEKERGKKGLSTICAGGGTTNRQLFFRSIGAVWSSFRARRVGSSCGISAGIETTKEYGLDRKKIFQTLE